MMKGQQIPRENLKKGQLTKGVKMELREVYERYKHLDQIICDPLLTNPDNLRDRMLRDFWQAINQHVKSLQPKE